MGNTKQSANATGYKLSLKITEKGGISVYGMQKFPTTLYADQWAALLDKAPAILAYIEANKDKLPVKPLSSGPAGSVAL